MIKLRIPDWSQQVEAPTRLQNCIRAPATYGLLADRNCCSEHQRLTVHSCSVVRSIDGGALVRASHIAHISLGHVPLAADGINGNRDAAA